MAVMRSTRHGVPLMIEDENLETRYGLLDGVISVSRFGYFQPVKGGPFTGWTTERRGGWYWSFRAVPVGPGARSGDATTWRISGPSVVRHRKRKDAQARARRLLRR